MREKKKTKKVMSKSEAATQARAGTDMGAPGPGFANIVKATTGKYGAETAKKIAGAQMQKMRKKGKL